MGQGRFQVLWVGWEQGPMWSEQTDTTENITIKQTTYANGNTLLIPPHLSRNKTAQIHVNVLGERHGEKWESSLHGSEYIYMAGQTVVAPLRLAAWQLALHLLVNFTVEFLNNIEAFVQ